MRSLALLLGCVLLLSPISAEENPAPSYDKDILPILRANCLGCHQGPTGKGGLQLGNIQSLVNGGHTGPVVVPGKSAQSYLFHLVARGNMPPQPDRQLKESEVEVIRAWIDGGLRANASYKVPRINDAISDDDRQHWAYQSLAQPSLPDRDLELQESGAIDLFIRRTRQAAGLEQAPPAARRTLLRRLYLDLLGIPPTPAEQKAFLEDSHPAAYDNLVDRLLASPQYGVRWGRHWLDLAGYADTVGFDHLPTQIIVSEGKWRYRDYVVAAMNSDLPYDLFIRQQLAGDERVDWKKTSGYYDDQIRQNLVATGFLRTARDQTHESVGVIPENFYNVLHDTTEIVSSSLLGLTVKCARCHDHKYDAITQRDYYQLQAVLMSAYNPTAWKVVFPFVEEGATAKDRSLPDVSAQRQAEITAHNDTINMQIANWEAEKQALRTRTHTAITDQRLATIPEVIRSDLVAAGTKPADQRNAVETYLVEKLGSLLEITDEQVTEALSAEDRQQISELDGKVAGEKTRLLSPARIQALFDVGTPPDAFILTRGQFEFPGRPVRPGGLGVLSDSSPQSILEPAPAANGSSGRRLALAHWLTTAGTRPSALVSRVIVNRIWGSLLGQGIVSTPGDFGVQGTFPTHPELLEWLALELQRQNWQLKPIVRAIVLSDVYRQASHLTEQQAQAGQEIDPANTLYWRMPLRRLESESIRDSLLAAGDRLNLQLGGPAVMLRTEADGRISIDQQRLGRSSDQWRRSVYLLTRRGYHHTLLDVFDQPGIETTCSQRQVNAVALQSLAMLNDQFVFDQAANLASLLSREVPDPAERIQQAYLRILCRPPLPAELTACLASLDDLQHQDGLESTAAFAEICHTLLNTSEFLYRE